MVHSRIWAKLALGIVFFTALVPGVAFAADLDWAIAVNPTTAASADAESGDATGSSLAEGTGGASLKGASLAVAQKAEDTVKAVEAEEEAEAAAKEAEAAAKEAEKKNKVLEYDRKLIKKIGTQEKTGHTICCPSFSCAYADAVLDGTVHDHSYYTCSCCTWPDWGGGNSSFRCVGDDYELLREAYDQIRKGKPTVIHVAGSSGEHWIALIGYRNAKNPDRLTLSNFIALDPWDGAQIKASDRYVLYGDGCEHVSDRKVKKG